jgi:hypothetical protein
MKYSELLDEYLCGIKVLNEKIKGLSIENLNYRPDRPDAWTIKEHIIHLVDCEVNGFIRCKSIIAQPFTECYVMDEDKWTKNLTRKNEDIQRYIQLFSLIRNIVFDLVKDEPEENWSKDYFTRTYKGETKMITIEDCITIYCKHILFHIEYIDRIKGEIKSL